MLYLKKKYFKKIKCATIAAMAGLVRRTKLQSFELIGCFLLTNAELSIINETVLMLTAATLNKEQSGIVLMLKIVQLICNNPHPVMLMKVL